MKVDQGGYGTYPQPQLYIPSHVLTFPSEPYYLHWESQDLALWYF